MRDVGVVGMRMSKFDMLMQVTMRFARWVIRAVYVLMVLIVHMEMGVSFGYEKQNASCHGT